VVWPFSVSIENFGTLLSGRVILSDARLASITEPSADAVSVNFGDDRCCSLLPCSFRRKLCETGIFDREGDCGVGDDQGQSLIKGCWGAGGAINFSSTSSFRNDSAKSGAMPVIRRAGGWMVFTDLSGVSGGLT
jgi:hypothetical protein